MGEKENFHVMAAFGDDFAFQQAEQDFNKWNEFMEAIKTVGRNSGYEVEILYSDIYLYFSQIGSGESKLHSYNGDFIPYIEPKTWGGSGTDFWTGFYTSRPHLKGLVFEVYNEIMATKIYVINAILHVNHYQLNLTKDLESILQNLNVMFE